MKATEYIEALRGLVEQHGDLECVDSYDDQIGTPELIDGCYVLADKA